MSGKQILVGWETIHRKVIMIWLTWDSKQYPLQAEFNTKNVCDIFSVA